MKIFSKLATLIAGMCIALTALGGAGSGGTIPSKTRLLLQSFAQHEAILTVDGLTNVLETDTIPVLKIDADDFKEILVNAQLAKAENKLYIQPVEVDDGSSRYFAFEVIGEPGDVPFFIRVEEVIAENEKNAE